MLQLPLGFLDGLGTTEMVFLGIIAILLFGERLPEVARVWGKKFVDFKRSVQGIQDELRSAAFSATSAIDSATKSLESQVTSSGSSSSSKSSKRAGSSNSDDDYEETTAPKFVPPSEEPKSPAA